MRIVQVGLFILAVLAFVGALFAAGSELGDILWRGGVAVLLLDLVAMKLWPTFTAPDRPAG